MRRAVSITWRVLVAPVWTSFATVVDRYLAAHAFASWVAHQGNGLRAVVRAVDAALGVLQAEAVRQCENVSRRLDAPLLTEAIRRSDLLLVHHADRQAMADALWC